jgi:hypothetical protein
MSEPNRGASGGLSMTLTLYYVPPPPYGLGFEYCEFCRGGTSNVPAVVTAATRPSRIV